MPYEIAGIVLVVYLLYLYFDMVRREGVSSSRELETLRRQIDKKLDGLIIRYAEEPYQIFREEELLPYEQTRLVQKLENLPTDRPENIREKS